MKSLDYNYDPSKGGKRWVSYFDRLGTETYTRENDLIAIFCQTCYWLARAREEEQDLGTVECAWFSDTILFYSADDSRDSFRAVAAASRSFFDELLDSRIPVRGALAFGHFYGDKANSLFFGEALVDACRYGEKFDWLGFVLHRSALTRMAEIGQPVSKLTYKQWDAEFKNRRAGTVETENVVAYLPGPGSIRPTAGDDPFLPPLREMLDQANCPSHRRKYENTIAFIRHFL